VARLVRVLGVLAAVALLVAVGPSRASAALDPGLCSSSTARGTIPNSFAAAACYDGRTLVLRNDLAIPMSVKFEGAVGAPQHMESDFGLAALAARKVSKDPDLLLPGDTLRFPIGAGTARIGLWGGPETVWDTYELTQALASFIPGKGAARVGAAVSLATELSADFADYRTCVAAGHGLLHKAKCDALRTRDVGFALARAGISAVAKKAQAVVLVAVTFSKWLSDSVENVGVLAHSGEIDLAGAQTSPAPTVAAGTIAVTIAGPSNAQSFSATLTGRPFPESLGAAIARFGTPSTRQLQPGGKNCLVTWPQSRVSSTFTTELGGTPNDGCSSGAGTRLMTFGAGWSTSTGLAVGASVDQIEKTYPEARAVSAGGWSLVSYFAPGAGQVLTELGAQTAGDKVTALTLAGIPDE
jgi:hypothetical protein